MVRTSGGYECEMGLAGVFINVVLRGCSFNPLTLRVAKRGLTILEILNLLTHFLENIRRRNVDYKSNKNSPSNIL